jgi:hypothetical protein
MTIRIANRATDWRNLLIPECRDSAADLSGNCKGDVLRTSGPSPSRILVESRTSVEARAYIHGIILQTRVPVRHPLLCLGENVEHLL